MNWKGLVLSVLATLLSLNSDAETKVNAYVAAGQEVRDITGVHYKCKLLENESPYIMILFGFHRTFGPGSGTYMLEGNLYANGLRYGDGVITTNGNIQGAYVPAEASLRAAIQDYYNPIHCGTKTLSPVIFPRQTYLVDNIANLWKTDMTSQTNLNHTEFAVEVSRAGLVRDYSGWQGAQALDTNTVFREWHILVTFGGVTHTNLYAVPDNNARYLIGNEFLEFESEFLWRNEHFKAELWDLQMQREGETFWRHVNQWSVTRQDDAPTRYGARAARDGRGGVIEVSNVGQPDYLPLGTIFDLSSLPASNNPPDIAICGLSLTQVASGCRMTLVTTVTNRGMGLAEPFSVGMFLSSDTNFDLTDTFTGASQELRQGLAAGASVTVTNSLDISSISNLPTGPNYILAVADYPGALAELAKTNNTRACGPITVARFLPFGSGTNTWQLPLDFNLEGWRRQEFPDARPWNTNLSAGSQPKTLNCAGSLTLQNGSLTNVGPTYTESDFYPYVMLDTNHNWLLLHPSSSAAASIGFVAPRTGVYRITGEFARANTYQYAGNGVTVAIARNGDMTNFAFLANIPSSAVVNPSNLFIGAGSRPFELSLSLVKGETVSFLVFNGPSGSDLGFDITALRFAVSPPPAPGFTLDASASDGPLAIGWQSLANELYEVQTCQTLGDEWLPIDTLSSAQTNHLSWQAMTTNAVQFFRVVLRDIPVWIGLGN